ncbi:MAG: NAD-dependent epimerase/dehydratase family protein, partial [Rubrobacteridae bacterium]|nr:NAD-dependent epimerase/dehydratase family protein [Rubrobacteridae bacterium]
MKIAVIGATGFIGIALCKELTKRGHGVVVFTRNIAAAKQKLGDGIDFYQWNTETEFPFSPLNEIDAIINLAGE